MFMKLLAQGVGNDVTPPKVVMLNFLIKQVSTSKRASQFKKNAKEIIAWEVAGGRHHGRSVKDRSLGPVGWVEVTWVLPVTVSP